MLARVPRVGVQVISLEITCLLRVQLLITNNSSDQKGKKHISTENKIEAYKLVHILRCNTNPAYMISDDSQFEVSKNDNIIILSIPS